MHSYKFVRLSRTTTYNNKNKNKQWGFSTYYKNVYFFFFLLPLSDCSDKIVLYFMCVLWLILHICFNCSFTVIITFPHIDLTCFNIPPTPIPLPTTHLKFFSCHYPSSFSLFSLESWLLGIDCMDNRRTGVVGMEESTYPISITSKWSKPATPPPAERCPEESDIHKRRKINNKKLINIMLGLFVKVLLVDVVKERDDSTLTKICMGGGWNRRCGTRFSR